MSFDVYFLPESALASPEDAMDALEGGGGGLAPEHQAAWVRIEPRVRLLLPAAEVRTSDSTIELCDDASGIDVSCFSGEFSLTAPYWYSGDGAEELAAVLLAIARVVEEETGLIAYDPQSEGRFLDQGAGAVRSSFDQVSQSFAERGIQAGVGELPEQPPHRSWWRRRR